VKADLERWLVEHGVDSLDAIRGLRNATPVEDADGFFRAHHVASQIEYLPRKLVQ